MLTVIDEFSRRAQYKILLWLDYGDEFLMAVTGDRQKYMMRDRVAAGLI